MSEALLTVVRNRLSTLWDPRRVGLFIGVGTMGATIDTVTLSLIVTYTAFGPIGGKAVAWTLAVATIFAINERWTFAEFGLGGPRATLRRLGRSYAVRFAGFLVSLTVLSVLVYVFDVWYVAANLLGIGVGFFVNYVAESLYTWRVHRDGR